jgi:outer membrane lipoprotein-sorting protein
MVTPGMAGRRAFVALTFVVIGGCASARPLIHDDVSPFLHRAPTVEEVHDSLRARELAVATFRGQARLEYRGAGGSGKSSQMVLVRAPNQVRIDVMNPFGPSYTVAADGGSLQAYDRGEKILYTGAATAANLETYSRVSLEIDVLARLIRALPPFSVDEVENPQVYRTVAGWGYRANFASGGSVSLELDRSRLRPLRAELVDPAINGNVLVEIAQYEAVDGIELAHRVHAQLADGSSVELVYSRIWRDVGLSDSAFRIPAPSGVRVVDMGRGN